VGSAESRPARWRERLEENPPQRLRAGGRGDDALAASSGAVYGRQPPELTHIPETYAGAPDPLDPASAYGEGKRLAEHLCALYHHRHGIDTKIARCFAFVGPHLPLDAHFAIGNFIRDALAGGPVRVSGDGTPCRSYLYAADLAVWLWTILFRAPACRPYNIGSGESVTILEAARAVAESAGLPPSAVTVARSPSAAPPQRYVPDVSRAETELGLRAWTPLGEAVARTLRFHQTPGGE
jgi:dTDP-glucose 4,6-dehydratase